MPSLAVTFAFDLTMVLYGETMASRPHLAIIAATRTICTIAAFVFMGQSSLAVLLLALGFIFVTDFGLQLAYSEIFVLFSCGKQ
jgi:hypothetical protein